MVPYYLKAEPDLDGHRSISKHDRGGYDGLCVPDLPLGLLPLLSSLVKPLLLTLQLENMQTLRTGTGSPLPWQ